MLGEQVHFGTRMFNCSRYAIRSETKLTNSISVGWPTYSVTQARFLLIDHLLREITILEITRGVSKCEATAKLRQSKIKYNIYKLHQSKGKIKNRTYTNYIIDRAGKFINGTAAALYIFII